MYLGAHCICMYITVWDCITTVINTFDGIIRYMTVWDGMIKYSSTQGDPSRNDTWVQCENNSRWFEKNCTVQEYGQMPIWEPCNYASNLAYYHTTTEICSRQQWNLPEDDGK